jgi:addiction module RelB/DinJ family antitoxin
MNNTKSNVNVKIDASVKERAAALFAGMGLDQTTAIELFYRKVIAERRLPFQPEPIPTNQERLLSLIKHKPSIRLEADENGNIVIDKEKHPQVYDWAVNG